MSAHRQRTRRCVRVGSYVQHYKVPLNRIGCSNWFDKFANGSATERLLLLLLRQSISSKTNIVHRRYDATAQSTQTYSMVNRTIERACRFGVVGRVVNIYVLEVKIENWCQTFLQSLLYPCHLMCTYMSHLPLCKVIVVVSRTTHHRIYLAHTDDDGGGGGILSFLIRLLQVSFWHRPVIGSKIRRLERHTHTVSIQLDRKSGGGRA